LTRDFTSLKNGVRAAKSRNQNYGTWYIQCWGSGYGLTLTLLSDPKTLTRSGSDPLKVLITNQKRRLFHNNFSTGTRYLSFSENHEKKLQNFWSGGFYSLRSDTDPVFSDVGSGSGQNVQDPPILGRYRISQKHQFKPKSRHNSGLGTVNCIPVSADFYSTVH
jgi:hypothetical protein